MAATQGVEDLGQDRAHTARVHNYLLGGSTHYRVDRAAGDAALEAVPSTALTARAGHTYARHVARHLTDLGVRQFLDLGVGLPVQPYLHETVQAGASGTRTLYIDTDPIVLAYADALLTGSRTGRSECLEADVRDPGALLTAVQQHDCIDLDRPVALFVHGLLDLLADDEDPHGIVQTLLQGLAPGSYLSLTHHAADIAPGTAAALVSAYQEHGIAFRPRTREQVEPFLAGLDLTGPGLTTALRWRAGPHRAPVWLTGQQAPVYAGTGRTR
ncbi:SAM-dependent methyltransferase [Streptomyces sp. CFMR 7]|uniref:SAM-dependent methyltransferase n=1 Tax=Streptomyces sp. CFMR 7 TaxID=1649184 RepID=UPI001642AE29|nr:SAM-dependent methyltransferase [Streptomyces sp. CFMR 7]